VIVGTFSYFSGFNWVPYNYARMGGLRQGHKLISLMKETYQAVLDMITQGNQGNQIPGLLQQV
jgi:hypothetical protein